MPFTVEPMESAPAFPTNTIAQNQFDLPVKEFMAYDPKGKTTVTNTPVPSKEAQAENPAQANSIEKEKAPDSGEPEKSVTLSPQISAIARKEAAQRQREFALKKREQELEAKLAKAEKYDQLTAKIANKDYSAADELGLTYDEHLKYELNKKAPDPAEQRYKKVEDELAALKKAQEDQTVKEYQANQGLWKKEITQLVKGNEAFPEINFAGAEAEAAVLQHINDSFDEDETELSAEEAAKEIEAYLADRALKLAESPTVKKKYEAAPKVLGPPKTSPKTITQNMTVTSQKPASKPFHLMSESEQIAEAYRRVQEARTQR